MGRALNRREFIARSAAAVAAVALPIPPAGAEPLTATSARMNAFRAMAAKVFEPTFDEKPLLPEVEAFSKTSIDAFTKIDGWIHEDGTPANLGEVIPDFQGPTQPIIENPETGDHFVKCDAFYDAYVEAHPDRWWMQLDLAERYLEKLFPDVQKAMLERDWGSHLTEDECREQCRWYYTPETMAELEATPDLCWHKEIFWAWDCSRLTDFGIMRPYRQLKADSPWPGILERASLWPEKLEKRA